MWPVSLSLIPETPWQQHGFTKVVLWPPYACCGVMVTGVPWEGGNQITAHSAGAMWGTLHRRECMHGTVELVKSPYLGKLECYMRIYCWCFAKQNVVYLSFNIYITTQDWLLALGTPPEAHRALLKRVEVCRSWRMGGGWVLGWYLPSGLLRSWTHSICDNLHREGGT